MITYTPIPVLFEIGKIKIYSFGFMAALALVVCYSLLVWQAKKQGKRFLADAGIYFSCLLSAALSAQGLVM